MPNAVNSLKTGSVFSRSKVRRAFSSASLTSAENNFSKMEPSCMSARVSQTFSDVRILNSSSRILSPDKLPTKLAFFLHASNDFGSAEPQPK